MVNFLLSQRQLPIIADSPSYAPLIPTPLHAPSRLPDKGKSKRFGCYTSFLQSCLKQEYRFCLFSELKEQKRQIVLRHDIDFDTGFALRAAKIENQLGIKATYFFLLRSPLYNILSQQDLGNINEIQKLGHAISIHFDPDLYEDFHKGLQAEVSLFRAIFGIDVSIISLHRPNAFFQEYDAPIYGIEHTYQSKYFREVKYISDSTGEWRYGHPFDSPEFAQQKSMHLLIHPIWWMQEGESNFEKIKLYYDRRVDALKADFSNNCIPFRKLNGHV